ncbi:MAG: InlB B-repeat-containing protein [Lachnospiraceae bacterium]|nr:InlB B-repeat-containing protein [Lachnospiraceae bacterium]
MSKKSKKLLKRAFALMLALVIAVPAVDFGAVMTVQAEGQITVKASNGYEEGAYVTWDSVTGADGYQVYVSKDQKNWPDKPIDDELIREYPDCYRADILGLTEGTWYIKIVAVKVNTVNGSKQVGDTVAEETVAIENVTSHDRTGYAWQNYEDKSENVNINTPGAYKKDGTLKDDTYVIYVTDANKDRVTLKSEDNTEYVGLQNILNAYKSLKITKPLDVRIIGNVNDFKDMDKGDIAIENGKNVGAGITVEGVGEDAVANGWGIRVLNASNVEIRNLGFMNCDSTEGDNIGIQQDNTHIWVHNCDFFYGNAGSEGDQKKGDGMLDCKKSDLITFSYNHFWDSGKSSLLGLREGYDDPDFVGRITYHHNWFDHSDSRHPRIRYFTTHIYNNYYDGNSKYGIGAAAGGASIFAENNYFRNCAYPMLISQQGSDLYDSKGKFESVKDVSPNEEYEDGSMIKAYNNHIEGATRYYPYKAKETEDSTVSSQIETDGFVAYVALGESEYEALADVNGEDAVTDDEPEENENAGVDEGKSSEDDENTEVNEDNASEDGENAEVDEDKTSQENKNSDIDADNVFDGNSIDDDKEILSNDSETTDDTFEATVNYARSDNFSDDASVDFDAYEVKERGDMVPPEVKTRKGEHTYNNFDIQPDFYSCEPDPVDDVPNNVKAHAGRVNGGDLKYSFDTPNADTSSDVDEVLKTILTTYESTLVSVGGIQRVATTVYYTVTFNPGNGEDSFVKKVEANTAMEKPDDPTTVPEGKVAFDGWYKGYRKWNFENVVTEDMTLVGQWLKEGEEPGGYEAKPIGTETVIHEFNKDGLESPYFDITGKLDTQAGTSASYNGVKYSSTKDGKGRLNLGETTKITFTTTTKAGIVLFLRTFADDKRVTIDGTDIYPTDGIITKILNDAKQHTITNKNTNQLYAIMVVPLDSSRQFTVTVYKEDGESPAELKVNEGNEITSAQLGTPSREGYKFSNWENNYGEEIKLPYLPLTDIAIKPRWLATVTFNTNGGSAVPAQEIKIGDKCTRPTTNPTREDYTFVDWYKDEACTQLYDFNAPVEENITIYAKWRSDNDPVKYTVTFKDDNGDIIGTTEVEAGQNCSKPSDPAKSGYTFDGWYKDPQFAEESKYEFNTPVNEDIILYAKWTLKSTNPGNDPDSTQGLKIEFKNEDKIYTYTGSAIKPEIIVTNSLNDKVLVEGVDYTVKYSNNVKPSTDSKRASITVTGKGIYAGKSNPKLFTIEKKDIGDTDNIKAGRIVVIKNQQAKLPILYYGSIKLTSKDIKFKNGNATFNGENENEKTIITGIGNNFTGEREIDVLVVADSKAAKAAAEKFTVELNKTALNGVKYTGNDLREQIRACITKVSDKKTGTALEANQYEIAFPDNVTDAGTVKFTIVGLDKYSGCNVVKSCKIQPKAIADADVVLAEKTENTDGKMVITGMIGTPSYKSTGATYDGLTLAWNYKDADDIPHTLPLTEGKDYKISYSGNKKASATPDSAKLTVTFKGNYKGKSVKKFSIGKAELSTETVSEDDILIADKVSKGKEGIYKSAPIVSMDGVTVKASEYDVAYYQDAGFTTPMDKDHKLKFTNITADKPYVTVYVKITAKAKSKNYKTTDGEKAIKGSYKVWVKKSNEVDLTKAKVVFYKDEAGKTKTSKLEYTGDVVVPGKVVVMIGKTEVSSDKYECKIINNVNKGKATVLVYAKDESGCIGAKTATYSIVSHSLNGFSW